MITSLRTKVRPDNLKTQVRSGGRTLARRLYLASVAILLSFVVYYTIGGFLLLEADGLVVTDRTVVASLYNARVVAVHVRRGEQVKKGTLLLTMQSPDLLVELGRHYTRRGEIVRRGSEIESRLASISTLKPLAASNSTKAKAHESATSRAGAEGFASTSHLAGAARDSYNAARDVSLLETEERSLHREAVAQAKMRAESDTLIQQLESIYDHGEIDSLTDGRVGPSIPVVGQVFRAGEPLLEILVGSPYVLAYLPAARAYDLTEGDKVIVTDGAHRAMGRVARQENIAEKVPSEFQSQFGSVDLRVVFRVDFNGASPFPLLSKVRVVNPASPSNVMALMLAALEYLFQGKPRAMARSW